MSMQVVLLILMVKQRFNEYIEMLNNSNESIISFSNGKGAIEK